MSTHKFETEWGGKKIKIETGKFACQANGSCTVQYGDTIVLATVVMSDNIREGINYFPLTCDFEERLYAAGKIKSSRYMKREGRPSDEAILTGRMIDRAIRPFFDDKIRNEIQIIMTVISFDGENDADIPAFIAASTALAISDIPWDGPIAGIRIGRIKSSDEKNNEWVINPTFEVSEKSDLNIIVAGTSKKVIMLEADAKEVSEEVLLEAIKLGQKHLKEITDLILEVQKKAGKEKLPTEILPSTDEEVKAKEEKEIILQKTKEFLDKEAPKILFENQRATKAERRAAKGELEEKLDKYLKEEGVGKDKRKIGIDYVYNYIEKAVSEAIIKKDLRVDGRKLTDIRSLSAETNIVPRTHGSSLFSRGETQILSVVTLGSPGDVQHLEGMEFTGEKRYFHHYNFPPYSVGEVGRVGAPGRREIGHGALAEKALMPVLPDKEEFPYTIRVVSEVLGSNGSSSMGSTCASSLALMDAGVPIKKHVAGIAMGIATEDDRNYKIITDLQDLEDGKGGMDFKITGTKDGITAIQLDTKTMGLAGDIIEKTLQQGKIARLEILKVMEGKISSPKQELSPYAPRIESFMINPDKIRDVIGPGGKVINEIINKTGVTIDIENDGQVVICSANKESLDKAVEWVKNLVREVQAGELFQGKVTRILDFGAFVEILPNQEGLVHISELAPHRVDKVEDVVKIGDVIPVKVIEIDNMGRINLSLKQAQGHPPTKRPENRRDSRRRPDFRRNRR